MKWGGGEGLVLLYLKFWESLASSRCFSKSEGRNVSGLVTSWRNCVTRKSGKLSSGTHKGRGREKDSKTPEEGQPNKSSYVMELYGMQSPRWQIVEEDCGCLMIHSEGMILKEREYISQPFFLPGSSSPPPSPQGFTALTFKNPVFLRTVPPFATVHIFCPSWDIRVY